MDKRGIVGYCILGFVLLVITFCTIFYNAIEWNNFTITFIVFGTVAVIIGLLLATKYDDSLTREKEDESE